MSPLLKAGALVRLTKVSETNPGAYPVGYYLEGLITNRDGVEVDEPIVVWRHCRAAREEGEVSPVMTEGFYHSSPVVSINQMTGDVMTENSVWRISPALVPVPAAPSHLDTLVPLVVIAQAIALDTTQPVA